MSMLSLKPLRPGFSCCVFAAALMSPLAAQATLVVVPAAVGAVTVGAGAAAVGAGVAGAAAVGVAGVAALGATGVLAGGVLGGIAITQGTIPVSTFTFTEGLLPFNEITSSSAYQAEHLELVIRAYSSNGKLEDVAINSLGVGVKSWFLEAGELNSSLFDDPGQYLTLTFNKDVEITRLTTTLWEDGFDNAVLSWGNNSIKLGTNNSGFLSDTFSFSGVVGREFKLQATDVATSFRLAGLNVVAVPEPSTYAMLTLGLMMIIWQAKRKTARAGNNR